MTRPAVLLTTVVGAVVLAGGVGVGIATADPTASPTSGSSPSASASATAAPSTPSTGPSQDPTQKRRTLTGRALHGEATLAGEKHRVIHFQRGRVSAVSATSVTVRSSDGFTGAYVVSAKTRVRVDQKLVSITEVATGDRVRVVAVASGRQLVASRVVDHG